MNRSITFCALGVLCLLASCATEASRLRSQAESGQTNAQYQLASLYWEGSKDVDQDRTEALKWYLRAAQHGHPQAQVRLAQLYEAGEHLPHDQVLAAQWYERAAEQGHVTAQVHLARLYLKGAGVPQNYAEARKLLGGAALQKHPEAQFLLGQMYWDGRGGQRDSVRAHMWFNLAAAQGHKRAESMRVVTATELGHEQLLEAQRLAVQQNKGR